ncbi:MAG: ketopantoate reductase family protein [Lautropia sp.]
MNICILGAGALGCAIGSALARAGSDVSLVNRSPAHVAAINRHGLRVREGETERTVPLRASTDCANLGPADLVIVLVKSFDTQAAIAAASPLIGDATVVMSLQNGLGHERVLAGAVGAHRVIAGRTYVGGVMLGPGHVIAGTRAKRTFIGELDGRASERTRAIAAEFDRAGLATTVADDIVGVIWDKLLVNVATGALAGITRLPYGPLYAVPEIESTALQAVAEAMAVASALGVRVSVREPRDAWTMAGAGLSDDFKTSMLQSLEKGSRTEIDFINGAVVREGERLGIPTPVNRTLVACIKGIEKGLGT